MPPLSIDPGISHMLLQRSPTETRLL